MRVPSSVSSTVALAVVAMVLCQPRAVSAPSEPQGVASTIESVTSKPVYAHSTWGIAVVDQATGERLIDRNGAAMFVPGSVMKTYSTATALKDYGPNYRFRTPVYRIGTLRNGVLTGTLVLVASGDFSFGLRDRPDGTLAFNSMPEIDHNYASTGFAGAAIVKGSNPLAALDQLAREVRSSGIRRVQGNVAIDDRLFAPYTQWPDGIVSPIWINENLIDITTTPTIAGKAAAVTWRPKTASLRVVSSVTTVSNGTKTPPLTVTPATGGVIRITGTIAAGNAPVLSTSPILEPADFARTAFIEALRRAGVTVSASDRGSNPASLLPKTMRYSASAKVAEHVSPPLSQYVRVVLKISYNRGADLMVCLVAVKAGSRNCGDGLSTLSKTIASLGVSPAGTMPFDGAGSIDDGRTTPLDETTLLRNLLAYPWGRYVRSGMAIMGVDGTQAMNQRGKPAAGHIRVKDGSRVYGAPAGNLNVAAKTEVGYIDAKSGRRLVYAIFVNNVPTTEGNLLDTFFGADRDVASIAAAIQQGY